MYPTNGKCLYSTGKYKPPIEELLTLSHQCEVTYSIKTKLLIVTIGLLKIYLRTSKKKDLEEELECRHNLHA